MTTAQIKRKTATKSQQAFITKTTKKVIKDYGKTLKMLAKE